jgi:L-ascorbate metabolism protein UlaG (beta-lactamase superfamily)
MAVKIRYLGWTAFELTADDGKRVLLDPLIAGQREAGIAPGPFTADEFYGVDVVAISHTAADHVGQAFDILEHSRAFLVCDAATNQRALRLGIPPQRIYRMVSGVRFEVAGFAFKALAAQHLSLGPLGDGFITGQPLSYVITFPSDEKVYFGGDTSITNDLKLFGELYRPDVAMLGVGGVDCHGQSLVELYPDEAALVAQWLGVQVAIPMHYRYAEEGEAFAREVKRVAPGVKALVMQPGDAYTYSRATKKAAAAPAKAPARAKPAARPPASRAKARAAKRR